VGDQSFDCLEFVIQQPKSLFGGGTAAAAGASPSLFGQPSSVSSGASLFGNVSGAASTPATPFGQKVFGATGSAAANPASSTPAAAPVTTATSGKSARFLFLIDSIV